MKSLLLSHFMFRYNNNHIIIDMFNRILSDILMTKCPTNCWLVGGQFETFYWIHFKYRIRSTKISTMLDKVLKWLLSKRISRIRVTRRSHDVLKWSHDVVRWVKIHVVLSVYFCEIIVVQINWILRFSLFAFKIT